MRSWNLHEIEVEGGSRSPVVLDSDEAARAVFIALEPGQSLGDHQVKEHAIVLVVEGKARVEAGDQAVEAASGTLCMFEPDEQERIRARLADTMRWVVSQRLVP